eukprot:TRINITY_DN32519_c0_g1_i1.p1 TRINITY_DN32519_c0_g1~~TRINITY_DN32519_c0_g1_i1.p1  ORF type:complete len:478 (+),score=190.15 TRINITY_DN32519_c0_g1_i1:62-1435(+)
MTTVERDHAFMLFCKGKSNRKLYTDACSTMAIRRNCELTESLSERQDAFGVRDLELGSNYLGAEGVRALFHLIQANKALVHVGLRGQGVTDQCASDLISILRSHPRVSSVDFRDNPNITHASSAQLLSLVRENKMVTALQLTGTRVPQAVRRMVERLAEANNSIETEFFKGDYMRMKRMFLQLDSDGSGRITTTELLANIDIPQVANTLMQKFESMDGGAPTGSRDNQITVNEFLYFTHPSYKTEQEIRDWSLQKDEQEDNIRKNHELIREALAKFRLVADNYRKLRIPDRILNEIEVNRLIDFAVQAESAANEDGAPQRGGKIVLSLLSLKKGLLALRRSVVDPELLGGGPRVKRFKMSPTLLRAVLRPFDERRRGADDRKGPGAQAVEIDLAELLAHENEKQRVLQTSSVRLHLKNLAKLFEKAGIPTNGTPMTLQEWVTCLEEYYEVIKYNLFR